jgi:hypothetical protein
MPKFKVIAEQTICNKYALEIEADSEEVIDAAIERLSAPDWDTKPFAEVVGDIMVIELKEIA